MIIKGAGGCGIIRALQTAGCVGAMNRGRIEESVERLCQKGCKALWSDIELMDRGKVPPELRELDERERAEVLREIKSIMAVYKGTCSL